jgi:hypothetical protein
MGTVRRGSRLFGADPGADVLPAADARRERARPVVRGPDARSVGVRGTAARPLPDAGANAVAVGRTYPDTGNYSGTNAQENAEAEADAHA